MRPDNVQADPLGQLSTTPDECAEGLGHKPGAPCSSAPVLELLSDFVEDADTKGLQPAPSLGGKKGARITREQALEQALLPTTADGAAVREAAALLGCASESCVLAHPAVREFAEAVEHIPAAKLDLELERRFKAAGPRDSQALLSNYNIDETLQRWARVFTDFYPCPFAMMDFDKNGDFFGQVDLADVLSGKALVDLGGSERINRKSSTFGCVLNTDTSAGPGKHWVAVFVDCRAPPDGNWTVEYFNSAGRPPPKPVVGWMARTRARLQESHKTVESVPVTDLGHQEGQTECGLYALYYIRCRLEGVPYTYFFRHLIPDSAMTAFRKHVFRAGK